MTAMEVIGIQINTAKLLHYTDLLKVMKHCANFLLRQFSEISPIYCSVMLISQ